MNYNRIFKNAFVKLLILFYLFSSNFTYADNKFSNYKKYKKTKTKFSLVKIASEIDHAWGMTFVDTNTLLITQKNGKLLKVNIRTGKKTNIKHSIQSLKFDGSGQGGLLDVLKNDDFIYFSYSHDFSKQSNHLQKKSSTAIARGKLFDNEVKDLEILLIAKPKLMINKHWGSRIIIKNDHLYASFGERDLGMIAQDASKHPGSIIRINKDGTIPKDNPAYDKKTDWLPEVYQIGLRNPQGMTISPHDNQIYFSQHGPRGGDNIGMVKYAGNFGWKDIAWGGREYYGGKIGEVAFKDKYDKHLITWVPSIGVGQIDFYDGETFKNWNGDMIVCSTKTGLLIRLKFKNNKIVDKEIILDQKIGRIRDFEIDSKGDIYIIVDEKKGALWKLSR